MLTPYNRTSKKLTKIKIMNREPITEEEQILFNKYLTRDDCKAISKDIEKPESLIYEIIKRRRKINERNENVLKLLYTSVYLKMRQEERFINENIKEVRKRGV